MSEHTPLTGIETITAAAGVTLLDYQQEALAVPVGEAPRFRACLYYRTGAGKTITALALAAQAGCEAVVVVAPPSTHDTWVEWGAKFEIEVEAMSHAKFRMPKTKLSRKKALIADEMHMFGGHGGKGWKKLEGLARGLEAPLILASATPNYNDADRVYCIQRVLDPLSCKGGFLEFLYQHCITEQDPFSMTPKVLGFKHYKNAADYLAALPGVAYLPDDLVWSIVNVPVGLPPMPSLYEDYGYNERKHRIVASIMEDRHTRTYQGLVDPQGFLHTAVDNKLVELIEDSATPVLVYCNHATVAEAVSKTLAVDLIPHLLVTGDTSPKDKAQNIQTFRLGRTPALVGTASLATGTDGIDKVCDRLIIVDDTDDDALRRQLVGRIMPRGLDTDASKKQVFRLC